MHFTQFKYAHNILHQEDYDPNLTGQNSIRQTRTGSKVLDQPEHILKY